MTASSSGTERNAGYNFAYLDEQTKRMLRRTILKAIAIPGYQVPIGGRELPLPAGWGTGGMLLTAALLGRHDVLKVIDQGADDSTNAISIRRFFQSVTGIETTEQTRVATIIQTRHRIPEEELNERQILVLQVPLPDPLSALHLPEAETRRMHAAGEYGLIYVRLYEDMSKLGKAATVNNHPVIVNDRYIVAPSPIPTFDNPKLHRNKALLLFGAGRHRRVYAIPPFTPVKSLAFDDKPFVIPKWSQPCSLCGAANSFLDELVADDEGTRVLICSDASFCKGRQERQRRVEPI
jgi:alpha-D-ribose 1-methylphosphonate 5-phosphate C-P lyase